MFPLLFFARLLVLSIKFVKWAMRINSATILCVKIAWSHASKRIVPRMDAYKMAATTVLVLYGRCVVSVGAGNTTIFSKNLHFCACAGNYLHGTQFYMHLLQHHLLHFLQ